MSSELEKAGDGFASQAPRNLQKSIDLEDPRASLLKLEGISLAQKIKLEELRQRETAQLREILEIEAYEKGERIRLDKGKLALASAVEINNLPLISKHPNVATGNISPTRISAQSRQGGGATPLKEAPQRQMSLFGQSSIIKRSSPPKWAAMHEQSLSGSDSAHLTPQVVAPAVYVKETSSSRAKALTGNSLERVVVERTEKDASDSKISSPADKEVENKIIANSFESLFKSRIAEQKKKKIDKTVVDVPITSQQLSGAVVTSMTTIIDADLSLSKKVIEQAPEATVAVQDEFPLAQNQAIIEFKPISDDDRFANEHLPVVTPAMTTPGLAEPSKLLSGLTACKDHVRRELSAQEAAVVTPPDPVHYTAEASSHVKPAETVISQPGHVKGLPESAKFVHRRDILPKPDFILLPASKHRSTHPFLSNVTIPPAEYKKFMERRNYTRRR